MDLTSEQPLSGTDSATTIDTTHHVFRLRFLAAVAALALVVSSLGLGLFVGHDVLPSSLSSSSSVPSSSNPALAGSASSALAASQVGTALSASEVAKIAGTVDPGLVDITTNLSYEEESAAGTGMILSANGLVLTNNHVISGATTIEARDVATGKEYKATVVGYDTSQDVALIQLQDASGLTSINVGGSNSLSVGEKIVGFGNAGGLGGTPSAASGKIVALDQSITASDSGSANDAESLTGTIEINADIQPGDSGGALVTTNGQVVGMDTAGSSDGDAYGYGDTGTTTQAYAIPINEALSIVKTIQKGVSTSSVHVGATAFLGVGVGSTSDFVNANFEGGTQSATSGALIEQIFTDTPAATSALVTGDVIDSLNGHTITTTSQLGVLLQELNPGVLVRVGIITRSGTHTTLALRLASGPPQ